MTNERYPNVEQWHMGYADHMECQGQIHHRTHVYPSNWSQCSSVQMVKRDVGSQNSLWVIYIWHSSFVVFNSLLARIGWDLYIYSINIAVPLVTPWLRGCSSPSLCYMVHLWRKFLGLFISATGSTKKFAKLLDASGLKRHHNYVSGHLDGPGFLTCTGSTGVGNFSLSFLELDQS